MMLPTPMQWHTWQCWPVARQFPSQGLKHALQLVEGGLLGGRDKQDELVQLPSVQPLHAKVDTPESHQQCRSEDAQPASPARQWQL